ncbi:hypothetical protein [uncultured Vagococcus sp.]|uniref:hypothetical protein n=1 Tax=uncultured Vagococcus sp. TaxID=189676 RepID=UPI0028D30019|nr:hypothetical protein [uncultured Vagococcus sp.]
MATTAFLQHTVEVGYTTTGQTTKQMVPHLKENVSSEKLLSLGQLMVELVPEGVAVEDLVTIKRLRHQSI